MEASPRKKFNFKRLWIITGYTSIAFILSVLGYEYFKRIINTLDRYTFGIALEITIIFLIYLSTQGGEDGKHREDKG